MFVDMALGTGRATRAERRNRKSGTIIRTAKNAGRVPAQKRGGKFHFSAVNSSFFSLPLRAADTFAVEFGSHDVTHLP